MTTRRPEHKPRRSSPLGMTGGIYRGSEAERYQPGGRRMAGERLRRSGDDRRRVLDRGPALVQELHVVGDLLDRVRAPLEQGFLHAENLELLAGREDRFGLLFVVTERHPRLLVA